jgi:PQQ-dependent dehydrogenase (s-GDH family)
MNHTTKVQPQSLTDTTLPAVAKLLTAALAVSGCVTEMAESDAQARSAVRVANLAVDTDRPRDPEDPSSSAFERRVITEELNAPYDLAYGPDAALWVTERKGKRLLRVDPQTGERSTVLTIAEAHQSGGQDGVLGFAFHPELLQGTGNDYVYLAYTYDADASDALARRLKIVRYTYDPAAHTLGSPSEIISGLSASNDHNSARLLYGPDAKLYYTIGDQGKNQFDNKCQEIMAQALPTAAEVQSRDYSKYQGKVLRIELDGSVPRDNPVIRGVRSHIYTYGHRNPQGLAFGSDGTLYSSEHGPKTDDEINLILPGRNYGWPRVAGFRDDKAYVYGNWSAAPDCEQLEFSDYELPDSVPQQNESDWYSRRFTPPLLTFYTVETGYAFVDPACAGSEYICWPTIGPASITVYEPGDEGVPGWGPSLLVPSLKEGSVFRVRLSEDRQTVQGRGSQLFGTTNRYRDVVVGPDQRSFFVITDHDGDTSGPTQGTTDNLENRGAIIEFRYDADASAADAG